MKKITLPDIPTAFLPIFSQNALPKSSHLQDIPSEVVGRYWETGDKVSVRMCKGGTREGNFLAPRVPAFGAPSFLWVCGVVS